MANVATTPSQVLVTQTFTDVWPSLKTFKNTIQMSKSNHFTVFEVFCQFYPFLRQKFHDKSQFDLNTSNKKQQC